MDDKKIVVFDTTLRDGEQCPGASMNMEQKLNVARMLDKMRVDVIEAGFPIASQDDFDAVSEIAKMVKYSSVCGLARAKKGDISRCFDAVKFAVKPRIHTFLASSDLHLKYKLKISRKEALIQVEKMVGFARSLCEDIEFSPEDASRSDFDFLCEMIEVAISCGASTINIPDTVGYSLPLEFGDLIKRLIKKIPNSKDAIFSVHCHNDLGLAVANSVSAVVAGARQVECTINGIGERAGNASLEELAMIFRTRKNYFDGLRTDIDISKIYPASRLVSAMAGFFVQKNKAIVGDNAFAHESGIHQDGVLKHRETYEIMKAEDIGLAQNKLVLGKHSGRHALKDRLIKLGIELDDEKLNKIFVRFKSLADKKKEIFDDDLETIVEDELSINRQLFNLKNLQILCGTDLMPSATVKITDKDGKIYENSETGMGPIDALCKAVDNSLGVKNKVIEFVVKAITAGVDALAEVVIKIKSENGREVSGRGADVDIVVASAKAYISAINKV